LLRTDLYHGDCLAILPKLPACSVDLVLCDPPFGTTENRWDSIIPLNEMWMHLRRVCKPKAAMLFFAAQPFTTTLAVSNLQNLRYSWTWIKNNVTGFLNAKRYPLKKHEDILLFCDGTPDYAPVMTPGKPYTTRRCPTRTPNYHQKNMNTVTENLGTRHPTSVLEYGCERGDHPTQKPVPLLSNLIQMYSTEGQTVLDFTCGSGSTGVAAVQAGRHFIGIERDQDYFLTAQRRILHHVPGVA
jgi:DNA modification methylase